MVEELIENGVPYSAVRDSICPGDAILLHHAYAKDWLRLNWYDKQIWAVQRFTGPFAHIGILDRIPQAGGERVVAYESVVPHRRCVRLSTTAERLGGFFWLHLNREISQEERDAIWSALGTGPYSKWGAIQAGLGLLPKDEDKRDRQWCAKFFRQMRALSGIRLTSSVPTAQALELQNMGGVLRFVRMEG